MATWYVCSETFVRPCLNCKIFGGGEIHSTSSYTNMPRGRRSTSSEAPAAKKSRSASTTSSVDEEVKVEFPEMEPEEVTEKEREEVSQALIVAPGRSSSLHAPNMKLEGHKGQVYSLAFDLSGKCLASGSMDKTILLWDVFDETCTNYNVMKGHKINSIVVIASG